MKRISIWKVILALLAFSPLALLPGSVRSALLPSEVSFSKPSAAGEEGPAFTHLRQAGVPAFQAERILDFLSPGERELLAREGSPLYWGGQRSSPLQTNEAVAIILTLLMLGAVGGFVIQSH